MRLSFRLVVLLLLGAAVNVAVAWTLAWRHPGDDSAETALIRSRHPQSGHWWLTTTIDSFGTRVFASQPFESESRVQEFIRFFDAEWTFADPPRWVRHPHVEDVDPYDSVLAGPYFIDVGRGWPFIAMMHGLNSFIEGDWLHAPHAIVCGIDAGTYTRPIEGHPRVLPLRPVFPGFLLNTLFYAAVLWLAYLVPFGARWMARRQRGLCPRCGYDLRAKPDGGCPECGWGRP